MKAIEDINKRRIPIVPIDPSLNQFVGKILFPEKLEKVNEMLKTAKLPKKNIG